MKWEDTTLGELSIETQYGHTASASEDKGGFPKFLRITDIVSDIIDWERVPYCQIDESKIDKYLLKEGDIVVARTGNTTGYAKLIRKEQFAVFASYLIRFQIDKNRAFPGFIGRVIESKIFKNFVNQMKSGAAQSGANATTLSLFPISLPPLPTQKKIAAILSTYDELIENNSRRIQLLEEAAQHLYREWFVQLRFPGHEQTPIDEETGLPVGWERKELASLANVSSSKRVFASDYVEQGIPFYRGKEISQKASFKKITDSLFISEERFGELERKTGAPKAGDILITAVGTIGNIHLVNEYDGEFYFKDGNVIWIRPNNHILLSNYIFQFFTSRDFKGVLRSITIGSSQKALTIKSVKEISILQPTSKILNQFNQILEPIRIQKDILFQENLILEEARDILLPRLMNQTIEVT